MTTKTSGDLPTIYLHGFTGEGSSLQPFAEVYSGDGAICINLPGFGGTSAPTHGDLHDVRAYSELVWQSIRREVPEGPVRLVGHSHGTMVGYTLAVLHEDEVASLDLFCPVVYPRLMPRAIIRVTDVLLAAGLRKKSMVRLFSRPWFVRVTTWYSYRPHWTADIRQKIMRMRQHEAKYYSPIMVDLMRQTLDFRSVMDDTRTSVPTRICYVTDDNVSGARDHEWYAGRTALVGMRGLTGGHLCVVAEPEAIANKFERALK